MLSAQIRDLRTTLPIPATDMTKRRVAGGKCRLYRRSHHLVLFLLELSDIRKQSRAPVKSRNQMINQHMARNYYLSKFIK